MILEEERLASQKHDFKREREFLKQQIRVGERYERLLSNSDFKDMLRDLEDTLKIHQSQLDLLDVDLQESNSPFKMNRISLVRKLHIERMLQIRLAIRRPQQLVSMADDAKKRLDEISTLEKEIPNA